MNTYYSPNSSIYA